MKTGHMDIVHVVDRERGVEPAQTSDKGMMCIHCAESGHDGDHVEWTRGAEMGDPAIGRYRSTVCVGDVPMCDAHIDECAREQGVSRQAVIFGTERFPAQALDLFEALTKSLDGAA